MRQRGSWQAVQEAMETRSTFGWRDPKEVLRDTDQALRDFERMANERLLRGLYELLGDEFEHRYLTDPIYSARIKLFMQMMIAILFDRMPLTKQERDDRILAIDVSLRDVESLLKP